MLQLTVSFSLLVVVIGAFLFVYSRHRATAAVALLVVAALLWFGVAWTMGRPKPVDLPGEATVISYHLDEGNAIFLWLIEPGDTEPRGYVIPWSMDKARKLDAAQGDAEEQGTNIVMKKEEGTKGGEFDVGPAPPQTNPPKTPIN